MNISNDPHSFYEPGQPRIVGLYWEFRLDFNEQRLVGWVRYRFDREGQTFLDTRDLKVSRVYGSKGDIPFELADPEPLRGSRLSFAVPEDRVVDVHYRTSPGARGIQWMSADVAGGHPFVYTQGEAINARTYIPCQDTPSVKFAFSAEVTVPKELRGLVAATTHVARREGTKTATEQWDMAPYPIPSYLIAFAVGDLERRTLSDRSAVWAQPHMVHKAADEFRDIPALMAAGEALFGPYPFGRYDVLVMPDAFPYGGMENPCLSFLTPALVAGDGSGISTVAHELAHSWTGNLVTNADWSSFWLNEGWTVWAEDRIVEAVYGRDAAMLGRKLLEREFLSDVERFKSVGEYEYTALAPDVSDVDPDDVFSRIPYFKGAQLLTLLENIVGREAFDAFVLRYIDAFKYQSITTGDFLGFLWDGLGEDAYRKAEVEEWVYEPGYPENAPAIESTLIGPVERLAARSEAPASGTPWGTAQLQLYLELLPRPASVDLLRELDSRFGLSRAKNAEVRWSFLVLAVQSGYDGVLPAAEAFLRSHGRMKYLKPLYQALAATPEGREAAERIFAEAKGGYHPVAVSAVEHALAA